ncbi:MAG: CBS domain-containing protein [Nitrosomonadales bacterium]|nr:CBS domain-containing protein [Nitrosomonadales bacterium]
MGHHAHLALHLRTPDKNAAVLAPKNEAWQVKLTDPAISIMTDFRERAFFTLDGAELIDKALDKMKHAGLRAAFVMDKSTGKLLGMITAYDIQGEKPLRFMQNSGFANHSEIQVADIMETAQDMAILDLHEVEKASIRALLDILQKCGRTHVPVVETGENKETRLRGLYSTAKVLRLTEESRKAVQVKA